MVAPDRWEEIMVLLSLLFWALLASYVVHILDETLLNGGFVQWIVDNTDRDGDAVQAMCALHRGTFVGTTPAGTSVSSQHVFGYGEINTLLALAQFLATHDQANTSGKLTDSNGRSFLALALQHCGTIHLETCLKTHVQPGHRGSKKGGNGHEHKHGNSNGRS